MPDGFIVTDWKGNLIEVGTRVLYGEPPAGEEFEYEATVVEITEPDVDYDDTLMRPVDYPPHVKLCFDDGSEETASTTCTVRAVPEGDGYSQPVYEVDDLQAIQKEGHPPFSTKIKEAASANT